MLPKKNFTITKYCDPPVVFGYLMAPGRSTSQVSSIIKNLCFLHEPHDLVLLRVRMRPTDRWRLQQLTRGFLYRILKLEPIAAQQSRLLAFCIPYPQFSPGALLPGQQRSSADSMHPALQRGTDMGSGSTATGRVLQV